MASPTSAASTGFPRASAPTRSRRSSRALPPSRGPACSCSSGRSADVNLQMAPSTVQETVTVTAETPLLERHDVEPWRQHRSAAGAGAPGAGPQLDGARDAGAGEPHDLGRPPPRHCRTETPASSGSSSSASTASRSRRSWDSAGSRATARIRSREFQFISNRFDATQGRSSGVQVRAITESGTNTLLGVGPGQLPRQPVQRARIRCWTASCRSTISRSPSRSAARSCATSCTSSATSNTSASRGPASGTRRTRASTSSSKGNETIKMGGVRLDYQLSPRCA